MQCRCCGRARNQAAGEARRAFGRRLLRDLALFLPRLEPRRLKSLSVFLFSASRGICKVSRFETRGISRLEVYWSSVGAGLKEWRHQTPLAYRRSRWFLNLFSRVIRNSSKASVEVKKREPELCTSLTGAVDGRRCSGYSAVHDFIGRTLSMDRLPPGRRMLTSAYSSSLTDKASSSFVISPVSTDACSVPSSCAAETKASWLAARRTEAPSVACSPAMPVEIAASESTLASPVCAERASKEPLE